jgi:hypothetical protein
LPGAHSRASGSGRSSAARALGIQESSKKGNTIRILSLSHRTSS